MTGDVNVIHPVEVLVQINIVHHEEEEGMTEDGETNGGVIVDHHNHHNYHSTTTDEVDTIVKMMKCNNLKIDWPC